MEPEHVNREKADGLFAFSSGRPQKHVFQTAGTRHVDARRRYEYWVETQIRHIAMDRPDAAQRRDFRAEVTSLASATMEVHYAESDAFSATRTHRDIRQDLTDELALFLVLEGSLHARLGDRHALAMGPNDFYLYDSGHPQRLRFSRNRLIQFDLSRDKLEAACGGHTPQPAVIADALRRSGLTPMLRLHLCQFPQAYLTGTSVAAYIREQRLQKLHRMLLDPLERRPIAALAPPCGLYDIPNVNQMFRKRFGLPPSQARRGETNPAIT